MAHDVSISSNVPSSSNSEFLDNNIEIKEEVMEPDLKEELGSSSPPVESIENDLPSIDTKLENIDLKPRKICNCVIEELLQTPYDRREFSRIIEIVKNGSPKPMVPIDAPNFKKNPLKELYYSKADWLTGCEAVYKFYCWPCLLFDRVLGLWNKVGFGDMCNFHKAYKRHEATLKHIVSSMQLIAFLMNHCQKNIITDTDKMNDLIRINRQALKRVIEVVCLIGGMNNNGVNTKQLLLLARSEDSPLSSISDLHVDCVKSINTVFFKSFRELLQKIPFVSLILDETLDGRIAAVVHYSDVKGDLVDTFAGFIDGNDIGFAYDHFIELYRLKHKIMAVLLGKITNLDSVPDKPDLLVLHFPTYRISDVVTCSLLHIKECAAFFHIIKCFEKWMKDTTVEVEIKNIAPNSNVAKWRERPFVALTEFKEIIQDVVHTLLAKANSCPPLVYSLSMALQQAFKDIEFDLLLKIFKELFSLTDALSDMILNNSPNIKRCIETVDDYIKVLTWKKEKFKEIWESVQEDSEEPCIKKPRHGCTSRLLTYYRSLFENIIDILVKQIQIRFKSLRQMEFAGLLNLSDRIEQSNYLDSNPVKRTVLDRLLTLLNGKTDIFETSRLKSEILVVSVQEDFKGLQCEGLLRHLYKTGLSDVLKQITKLARLIIVIPYSSKINYDHSTRLLSIIQDFSRKASDDMSIVPWHLFNFEETLISKFAVTNNFMNDVIENFAENHPSIELNFLETKNLNL